MLATKHEKSELNVVGREKKGTSNIPLYSRKLHMRVRLDSTSCVTSLMILALSFGERVVNHFASRWMGEICG
jgi:hypothetical protein